ncbi:MAG: hypothetical protein H7175_07635, partial [Burkholderiales bacterium]|nr:hypothetical protein [Anaerolineae bacterium]
MQYAEIAVDAPVQNTFHYHIPPELEGRIVPGQPVQVVFGTAPQNGMVLALLDETPLYQTKPIVATLDPRPLVSAEQIDLARWLSEYYLAPVSACLRLMYPGGIISQRDTLVTLRDRLDEDEALTTAADKLQKRIVTLLRQRGAMRGGQLAHHFRNKPWRNAVEALTDTGVVDQQLVIVPPRLKPKIVQTAALAIHPAYIPAVTSQ